MAQNCSALPKRPLSLPGDCLFYHTPNEGVKPAAQKIQRPVLKYDQLKFFFERFTKGDPSDINYRKALADIFIGRIELFEDHMIIYYNASDGQKGNVPIGEPDDHGTPRSKVPLWGTLVGLQGLEPRTNRL